MAVQYITFLLHKICSFPYSIIAIFLSSRLLNTKLTLRLLCTLCREPSKHLRSQMSIVASINSNKRKFTWTRMFDWSCLQHQKWCPYKGRGVFTTPVCTNTILQPAIPQPAKAAAMCTACHDYAHLPAPTAFFLLAQNLSSKRIDQLISYGQSHDVRRHILRH